MPRHITTTISDGIAHVRLARPDKLNALTLEMLDDLAAREEIVQLYDERFYRMWRFYLAGATAAFEWGGMCNYQIQYIRNRYTLPITRDYLGEREKGLLKKG